MDLESFEANEASAKRHCLSIGFVAHASMGKDISNRYASTLRTKTVLWYIDKTPNSSILTRIYITSCAVVQVSSASFWVGQH